MHQRILINGAASIAARTFGATPTSTSKLPSVFSTLNRSQNEVPFASAVRTGSGRQRWSRRRWKSRRGSTSRILQKALEISRRGHPKNEAQLIEVTASNYATPTAKKCTGDSRQAGRKDLGTPVARSRLTLPLVLATYTRLIVTARDASTTEDDDLHQREVETELARDAEVVVCVENKGYSIADIRHWHHIITCQDDVAAFELMLSPRTQPAVVDKLNHKTVPWFVFLYSLRRDCISPEALRAALTYTWQRIDMAKIQCSTCEDTHDPNYDDEIMARGSLVPDSSTMFLVILRLVRYARMVLPEALESLARLFTSGLDVVRMSNEKSNLDPPSYKSNTTLTNQCNRLIKRLSLPCSVHPFLNTTRQQTAQFHLLQKMAEHRPVVPVTREGYQAIARVQLASRKTPQEQDWASLKASTWPPWKEDKIGFDAEKGPQYGVSQALHAIHHARQTGYGSGRWEQVARILSGWDTDGSPTIQTRAWLLPNPAWARRRGGNILFVWSQWAARIRATRTVNEAWACFLAFRDRGLRPHQTIYLEMFRKLSFEHLRTRRPLANDYHSLSTPLHGGDAREVFASPVSSKEGIYVRVPPPTMDGLAEDMIGHGILPTGPCLAFLVSEATSLTMGIKYLEWARPAHHSIDGLLAPTTEKDQRVLDVPVMIFHALIQLLCRCHYARLSASYPARGGISPTSTLHNVEGIRVEIDEPIVRAFRLMELRAPKTPQTWHVLLAGLTAVRLSRPLAKAQITLPEALDIERWKLVQSARRQMKTAGLGVDLKSFRLLCRALEISAEAAIKIQSMSHSSLSDTLSSSSMSVSEVRSSAEHLLSTSFSYIRRLFYELFGTSDARSILSLRASQLDPFTTSREIGNQTASSRTPRLLASPEPAVLHFYIRVIGVLGHHHGMLELVRWMVVYKDEINAAAERPRNGQRILRRALIAIRVFTERVWAKKASAVESAKGAAPVKTLDKLQDLICSVEGWGGWPTDEETEEYCAGRLVSSLAEIERMS